MAKARALFQSSLVIILVFLILLALHWLGWLRPIENGVTFIFEPVVRGMRVVANRVGNSFEFVGNIGKLADENKSLSLELEEAKSKIASLQEATAELDDLRQRINTPLPENFQTLRAGIIGHDGISATKKLIINKGENDGVREGQAVISAGGSFIGKVISVQNGHAEVMLITDDRSVIPARVSESRASGLLRGELGLGLKMTDIPQQDAVQAGDIVVTSGLSGDLPKGLVVGTIETIEDEANALFQVARLRPGVDVNSLEFVYIVTKY